MVYKIQCKDCDCEKDYIGGTARPSGIRLAGSPQTDFRARPRWCRRSRTPGFRRQKHPQTVLKQAGIRLKERATIKEHRQLLWAITSWRRGIPLTSLPPRLLQGKMTLSKDEFREVIEIHCQASTLNRDNGYELPVIYRNVLSRVFTVLNPVTNRQAPPLNLRRNRNRKRKKWILRFVVVFTLLARVEVNRGGGVFYTAGFTGRLHPKGRGRLLRLQYLVF